MFGDARFKNAKGGLYEETLVRNGIFKRVMSKKLATSTTQRNAYPQSSLDPALVILHFTDTHKHALVYYSYCCV